MKRIYLIAAIIILIVQGISASAQNGQRNCGTMDYLAAQIAADPGLAARMQQTEQDINLWLTNHPTQRNQTTVTIPVVFHVLYNTTAQNISDTRILAQLDVLNRDFARLNADASNTPSVFSGVAAGTTIQFCLAQRDPSGNATTGIVRKSTAKTSFSSNDGVKYSSQGGDDAWSRDSYLNIWSCNLGQGLLGYAQFPGGAAATDGVVLLYSSIGGPTSPGTATPYHLGRTATHEVGHWINLRHIWGDANCGNDLVSDTPTQQTSNFGCPSFPHVTCSNGPNGDMFMNYMDYTDDACMNMFTTGQASRMDATLSTTRASLLTSMGCQAPGGGGTSCGTPSGLSASAITTTDATLNWNGVSGSTSYSVQYRVNGTSTWTTVTSTTNSKTISSLIANTTYNYQVQANCNGTLGAYSTIASFTTLTGSTGCTDTWEPNNTSSAYKIISTNTDIFGTISTSTDQDWYRFSTTTPNTYVKVELTNLPADYDVTLYSSSLRSLGTGQNSGTANELVKRNTNKAATYYVKVYGYQGANNTSQCYTLRVSTRNTSWRLGEDNADINAIAIEELFNLMPNPANNQVDIELFATVSGTVSLKMYDITGREVKGIRTDVSAGINKLHLETSTYDNGIYFIVAEHDGLIQTGRLVIAH